MYRYRTSLFNSLMLDSLEYSAAEHVNICTAAKCLFALPTSICFLDLCWYFLSIKNLSNTGRSSVGLRDLSSMLSRSAASQVSAQKPQKRICWNCLHPRITPYPCSMPWRYEEHSETTQKDAWSRYASRATRSCTFSHNRGCAGSCTFLVPAQQ